MSKLKVGKSEVERLRLREEFSSCYKTLNGLAGSNTAHCYAVFKYSFYNVRDGRDLLIKKGLIKNPNNQLETHRYSKYLDYAGINELTALLHGLLYIRNMIADKSVNFLGYPFVYEQILKMGREKRYQFLEENGNYPENMKVENKSIASLKKIINKTQNSNIPTRLTRDKEMEQKSISKEDLINNMRAKINDMNLEKMLDVKSTLMSNSLSKLEFNMKNLYLDIVEESLNECSKKKKENAKQSTLFDDNEKL